jgi:alpha-glucuronidase
MRYLRFFLLVVIFLSSGHLKADDGYRLWLRYDLIDDPLILKSYRNLISSWMFEGTSPLAMSAAEEMKIGLNGLLGSGISGSDGALKDGLIVAGTPDNSKLIRSLKLNDKLAQTGDEGFLILSARYRHKRVIVIAANRDAGVLYGTFRFLQLLRMHKDISALNISSSPKIKIRILNHWDNLNRSVERGYAGLSLWDWKSLPDSIDPRYTDYARANASIGINATVLTNVNANALVLTPEYLKKVAALADVFRPYGIRVYLTARFSAPIETGKLKTADPLDPGVIAWWKAKAAEIYSLIPDFGGFLVKANSEGQPGPQTYGRSHADGANMLADAVAPFGGIIMWRAFVYDNNVPDDRAKQAYNEFVPLDGKFRDNVIIQVKNGPIDFQPREPFHPLFGAMTHTPLMMEFQVTQEYLGASVHLVYLGPLFEECLKSDTWAKGRGSLVAKVIDGSLMNQKLSAMAGVTNIGNVRNWNGHTFAQANWYVFGRLAWDPYLSSSEIADEWIRMTLTNEASSLDRIKKMMLRSREITVSYMTPLGLHHQMYAGHHYGPGPWVNRGRADQTSVYFSKADSAGIGFDRTSTGSKAVDQYFPHVRDTYEKLENCPENLLLWFHHLPWNYKLASGQTLWNGLCLRYQQGVDSVRWLQSQWNLCSQQIDPERFGLVNKLLTMQERDAKIWRDACILYFQTFSKRPIPEGIEKPEHDLEYYKSYRYSDIPGISKGY